MDACAELAYALNKTCAAHFKQPNKSDREEVAEFARRAKNGYEEQLGRESEKALKTTISTTMCASITAEGIIAKLSDLAERCKWLLGADNEVTLDTLDALAIELDDSGKKEEARELYERCLATRMVAFGGKHHATIAVLCNLGAVECDFHNYQRALDFYERALVDLIKTKGLTHPSTLLATMSW